jgi:hypothetical protein
MNDDDDDDDNDDNDDDNDDDSDCEGRDQARNLPAFRCS